MLSLLHIENIALISSADIQFGGGFNVLTGETGAGKSIVVDSISAVLGERTSRDLIRTGAKSATVSAVFVNLPKLDWLEHQGIAQGEELVLRREIKSDGRNNCRVDGNLITVSQLKELGRQLLNIHGQHDGQQLLDPSCHLDYLDSFGKTGAELEGYQTSYHSLSAIRREISSLQMNEAERQRRVDTLSYQIAELERGDLKAGEDEELNSRKTLLRSGGKLMAALQSAQQALSGDDDSAGACALIGDAQGEIGSVARYSPQLDSLAGQMGELSALADDIAEQIRDLEREMDFSPEELEQLENRLDILYRLGKKYGSSVADMLDYLEQCHRELAQIEDADDRILLLEKEQAKCLTETRVLAEILSQKRKAGAEALKNRVESELKQLDMPKIRFLVEFQTKSGEFALDDTGCDEVQFLMSANVGEDLKPIQRVASGGELARIMLALKNVLAEDDGVMSLVFDEVDTGVSGRAAQKVAEKMAQVASHKQVLCVTHLPQIAAMADIHLRVEKGERDGRTFTQVEELDNAQRRQELARLIGGSQLTQALEQSAQELLDQGEAHKKQFR